MTTVLVIGQSLGYRVFANPEGVAAFEAIVEEGLGEDVEVINACVGGTPLTDIKPLHWTDFENENGLYQWMLGEVGEREVDYIIFVGADGDAAANMDELAQGQDPQVSADDIFEGMVELNAQLEADFGDVPILVMTLHQDWGETIDIVNDGLFRFTASDDNAVIIDPPDIVYEYPDLIHYSAATGVAVAEALAEAIVDPPVEVTQVLIIGVNVTPEELPGYGFTQEQIDFLLAPI